MSEKDLFIGKDYPALNTPTDFAEVQERIGHRLRIKRNTPPIIPTDDVKNEKQADRPRRYGADSPDMIPRFYDISPLDAIGAISIRVNGQRPETFLGANPGDSVYLTFMVDPDS